MTKEDLGQIEALIKKHKSASGDGCLTLLFILFLLGFFEGCGYLG